MAFLHTLTNADTTLPHGTGTVPLFHETELLQQGIYTVCAESPLHSLTGLKGLNGELGKSESQTIAERVPKLETYIRKLVHTCEDIQVGVL